MWMAPYLKPQNSFFQEDEEDENGSQTPSGTSNGSSVEVPEVIVVDNNEGTENQKLNA